MSDLLAALAPFPRILITGGPRTGKTTVAFAAGARLGIPVHHTDELAHLDWHDASHVASHWIEPSEPWLIEGIAVPRALRKWLARHPGESLDAAAVYLLGAVSPRTKSQLALSKGVRTVWEGIRPELRARGVQILVTPRDGWSLPKPSDGNTVSLTGKP